MQVLRAAFDARAPAALRALLDTGAPDVVRVLPELARRLADVGVAPALASEQDRFRFFDTVARVLQRIAREKPLVIALDDLHRADQPSLRLLRFLSVALVGHPVLLVGA